MESESDIVRNHVEPAVAVVARSSEEPLGDNTAAKSKRSADSRRGHRCSMETDGDESSLQRRLEGVASHEGIDNNHFLLIRSVQSETQSL